MAAKCKVNLVAFPFFIKQNYPKNPAALNAAAKRSCNAVAGMAQLGVSRASVVTLVSNASIAQSMCGVSGSPREFNSCAEVGYPVAEGQKARMQATGTWGGQANSGETAAAIVGPGGLNAATVAGRVQGQAQMGLPFGAGAGNGTGDFAEGYATAGSKPEKGWSKAGCDKMRETAFPNTGNFKYLPTQEHYVALGKNLWDIMGERTIFNVDSSASDSLASGHPGKATALSQNFFEKPPDIAKNILPVDSVATEDGHKLRTASIAGAGTVGTTTTATTSPIKPKLNVGGQLNAFDNSFMQTKNKTSATDNQPLNGVKDSKGSSTSNGPTTATNRVLKYNRRTSSQTEFDPGYFERAKATQRETASSKSGKRVTK
jgi:hypothetical protein